MKEAFEMTANFTVEPQVIYKHWLESAGHAAMTGGEAQCGNQVGDEFSAWDGYISGRNLELEENKLITQSWRTSEFAEGDADSLLEIHLKAVEGGCELKLLHSNIPEGQTQYKQGWVEHYFEPMERFFSRG